VPTAAAADAAADGSDSEEDVDEVRLCCRYRVSLTDMCAVRAPMHSAGVNVGLTLPACHLESPGMPLVVVEVRAC
jgi:hypothetical protein